MAAEFSYKPVQSLSCELIDIAIASAGHGRDQEDIFNFLCEIGPQRIKVIGPVLQLILPDANQFRGRIPITLIEYIGRESVPKRSASLGGNA